MSITSKLLLTVFFCSAQQAKYSWHKQLIMIYRLLADLYKTVKIDHDNTEVKQSNVVLMYSSSIQLLQLGQIQVGGRGLNFGCKISKFGAGGRRNRGNCVMRTRIRKPGSTFFPCIPFIINVIVEINFSSKVYSKSLLKVESLKGSVVYSLILDYQFCACVMRISGVPQLQVIHMERSYDYK